MLLFNNSTSRNWSQENESIEDIYKHIKTGKSIVVLWHYQFRHDPNIYYKEMVKLMMVYLFFKYIYDYAIAVVPFFSPCYSPPPCTPSNTIPHHSSCPWVIHISPLDSPFPTLFLTSPCLFSTYHLCFLFPVPFPHFPCSLSPLVTLHVISISVILFLFYLFTLFLF